MHPLGPVVRKALVFYPYDQARTVARGWRDLTAQLPDTVSPEFVLWSIPADPAIPAALHGAPVVIVGAVYAGDPADAGPVLAPLAELGTPLMQGGGDVHYAEMQQALDPAFPAGGRYFFKSHFVRELTDDAIDTMIACDARRATPQSLMVIRTLGGAVDRVDIEESAYPHRGARYNLSIDAGWTDPALDDTAIGWARSSWDALREFATGGVYVNFAGLDEESGRDAVFGQSTDRLDEVQASYDPDGLFAAAARRP